MGIKEMRILAEEGSLPHILAFADMHFGFGDYQEALRWYRMAAQQTAAPQVTQRAAQCEACLAMTPQELAAWRQERYQAHLKEQAPRGFRFPQSLRLDSGNTSPFPDEDW